MSEAQKSFTNKFAKNANELQRMNLSKNFMLKRKFRNSLMSIKIEVIFKVSRWQNKKN